jgi:hypothetical protein
LLKVALNTKNQNQIKINWSINLVNILMFTCSLIKSVFVIWFHIGDRLVWVVG